MAKLIRNLSTPNQNPTGQSSTDNSSTDYSSSLWSSLVPVHSDGALTPFFCIPGAGGNAVYLHELAREMRALSIKEMRSAEIIDPEKGDRAESDSLLRPFYTLQPPGLDGVTPALMNMQELASHYVETIKTVQPDGPFYLGGHSFGGLVAFEMARQLQKQGYHVPRVLLIDTPAPNFFEPTGEAWDEAKWLAQIADIAGHQYGIHLDITYESLKNLEPEEQISLVHDKMKKLDILTEDSELNHFRGFLNVYKSNLNVEYRPQMHISDNIITDSSSAENTGTRFTLLRSRDEQPENLTSTKVKEIRAHMDLGWKNYILQPVEVIEIPGDHLTMLNYPNTSILAEKINQSLRD